MNILLLLTGGTICSFANENNKRYSDTGRAKFLITENFKKNAPALSDKVNFTFKSVLNILSENMSSSHWNRIIKFLSTLNFSEYDGIVILHGTDTLAYTSSLLSLLLAGTKIPVMLVSSYAPLDFPDTNGNENFKTAIELIENKIPPNVYAVYKNRDGVLYLHYASHLLQCKNGSDDFYSCDMMKIEGDFCPETHATSENMLLYSVEKLKSCVLAISPYPSVNYSHYSLSKVKAILHGTYHSCTVPVLPENSPSSILTLNRRAKRLNIPIYIHPCHENSYKYETTGIALRNGIKPTGRMTFEMTYIKLLVGCSLGLEGEKLDEFLKTEINAEFIN